MKRVTLLFWVIASMILFSACESRKNFEPKEAVSASSAISKINKKAVSIMRDGITFSDGTYLTRSGMGSIKIPKGFHYVNQSSSYVLIADDMGNIEILSRKSGKLIKKGKLPFALVSATIAGNSIYYVSLDDVFGIYSISANKPLVSAKVGQAYAVDTRIANPIIFHNLVVVPTLDGKLLIINPRNPKAVSGLAIGDSHNLNNVIFLKGVGNTIIAATPKKLISAAPGNMHKYESSVADVAISGGYVYLLTGDGRVVKLTITLKVVAQKKFQYASFSTIAVVGGKVYALDRSGSLIVLDSSLKKYKVYRVGEVKDYAFVAGKRLYKDDEVIDLSKLSY